jgi:tRNA modification GTPase
VLFFPAPNSFTGEDVIELQGHGSPIVLDALVEEGVRLGARLARPGEYSERAYLNDKMDLAQAEAVADLIQSSTKQAARAAMRSLSGHFSKRVAALLESLVRLRVYVEAAIDFPEEEIDFLSDGKIKDGLVCLVEDVSTLLAEAGQGSLLMDGIHLVIAGEPNAGKSSLLNALSGQDSAIVTDIPGTTRDTVRESISLDGMPVNIVDTAGLRDSPDAVELLGMEKTLLEVARCDHVLLVIDSSDAEQDIPGALKKADLSIAAEPGITVIFNKIDKLGRDPITVGGKYGQEVHLSALTGNGLNLLKGRLKEVAGYSSAGANNFTARRRHIDGLRQVLVSLDNGGEQLSEGAGELLAEELRQAQQALGEITGEFSSDDLLGEIFGSFCVGK